MTQITNSYQRRRSLSQNMHIAGIQAIVRAEGIAWRLEVSGHGIALPAQVVLFHR